MPGRSMLEPGEEQFVHLIVQFADGSRTEAVVLAMGAKAMRLAVAGRRDAVDCRLSDGHWTLETGDVIELESMVADEASCRLAAELFHAGRTIRTAGR